MNPEHIRFLCDPKSRKPLSLENAVMVNGAIKSGILKNEDPTVYRIIDYIPRFIAEDNYCESFTVEWEKHPDTLRESSSSYTVYKERFTKETKWPPDLKGELLLEAGCGCGALTPYALETGATVISFDASSGVKANFEKNSSHGNLLVAQASIIEMPFPDGIFDRIFCFGVLQHTPAPKESLSHLVSKLKPGGSIASDIYIVPPRNTAVTGLLDSKYFARRFFSGISPKILYGMIKNYVNLMWPITRLIGRHFKNGVSINRKMLFDDYSVRLQGMKEEYHKDFAVLDIFDMLSPRYDIPATVEEFRKWHEEMGLENIEVHQGYNGIEGRATKPKEQV